MIIGLLTPFRVSNYGTKLQAYAIQEYIRSISKDVEIIDYRFGRIHRTPINVIKKLFYNHIANKYRDSKASVDYPTAIKDSISVRKKAIDSFDNHYILSKPILGTDSIISIKDKYDIVFCGSDQIWNPVNVGGEIYLLEWTAKDTKRASFAASFGVETLPWILKKKYEKELKKFNYISVREDTGLNILRSLGINNGEQILDPTLILDPKAWFCLSEESKIAVSQKYIFCYFLGDLEASRRIATYIRKLTGYIIVNMPHFKGFVESDEGFGDIDLFDVSVQDFLQLIRNAEMVCTDSFHATAFSVIFEKEFVVCNRHGNGVASTNSRIHSFLHSIGAEKRICSSPDEVKTILKEKVEYEGINRRLNEKRKESIAFIKKSLS